MGTIPLSPQDPTFTETRYWRLPVSPAAIFAALIERLQYDSSKCEDIRLARSIRSLLDLQSMSAYPLDDAGPLPPLGPSGGSGPSGGGGRGGHGSKRKGTGGSPSSGKGNKKARKASGGASATGDCGEPSKASGELIATFQLPLRPSCNIDFSPKARSQNEQSHHQEIAALSHSMEAPVELMDTGWNDTDSEVAAVSTSLNAARNSITGCKGISATSPHDKDDPATWRFDPSFSTNKIIFTATAVNLTL